VTATARQAPGDSATPELPRNLDAERSVLGAILLDNKQLAVAAEMLRSSDFSQQEAMIFTEMLAMADAQIAIDTLTLKNALQRNGKLEAAGGNERIDELVNGVPRVTHLEHYARIVKEKSRKRQLILMLEANKQAALEGAEEGDVILERVAARVTEIRADQAITAGDFDTQEELDMTADATFSIKGFLQDFGVNAIAGLSGHGKTWFSLNIVNALLFGPGLLWDHFEVTERAEKIIYLIPEVTRSVIKPRLKAVHIYDEIDKRLFIRTLSKGPALPLTDARILREVKGAHVVCDTAIRFMRAVDENSAAEAAGALSEDFFVLLHAGAKTVIPLFHSPKAFLSQTYMTLEGMIRGSSEFGAVLATAWGIRQIDSAANIVHVENLKARDFEPSGPFQLSGRPHIDQQGSFALHRSPGDCGKLAEYLEDMPGRNRGGAPESVKEARAANLELLRQWLAKEPQLSSRDLSARFSTAGIKLGDSAIRKYRKELGL